MAEPALHRHAAGSSGGLDGFRDRAQHAQPGLPDGVDQAVSGSSSPWRWWLSSAASGSGVVVPIWRAADRLGARRIGLARSGSAELDVFHLALGVHLVADSHALPLSWFGRRFIHCRRFLHCCHCHRPAVACRVGPTESAGVHLRFRYRGPWFRPIPNAVAGIERGVVDLAKIAWVEERDRRGVHRGGGDLPERVPSRPHGTRERVAEIERGGQDGRAGARANIGEGRGHPTNVGPVVLLSRQAGRPWRSAGGSPHADR